MMGIWGSISFLCVASRLGPTHDTSSIGGRPVGQPGRQHGGGTGGVAHMVLAVPGSAYHAGLLDLAGMLEQPAAPVGPAIAGRLRPVAHAVRIGFVGELRRVAGIGRR